VEHHSLHGKILKMISKLIYGSYLNEKRKGRNVKLNLGVHRSVCESSSSMDVLSTVYKGAWGLIAHSKRVPHLKGVVCNPHVT
jgi:hypothetical protein